MHTGMGFTIAMILWLLVVGGMAWAEAPDDDLGLDEQGQPYQLPALGLWVGRRPSPEELRAVISQVRIGISSRTQSAQPDYQIAGLKFYIGNPLGQIEFLRPVNQR